MTTTKYSKQNQETAAEPQKIILYKFSANVRCCLFITSPIESSRVPESSLPTSPILTFLSLTSPSPRVPLPRVSLPRVPRPRVARPSPTSQSRIPVPHRSPTFSHSQSCFVNNTATYFNLFVCSFKKRDMSVM